MMSDELTTAQATDLAKYFLGPDWRAAKPVNLPEGSPQFALYRVAEGELWIPASNLWGDSWRAVFRAAGVKLPSRSRFTSNGLLVRLDDRLVATATSGTFAKRITNALNRYEPDKRGF